MTDNLEWTAFDGRKIKFKDIDDKHLANILRWVRTHSHYPPHVVELIEMVVQHRGLTQEFLDGAEYPYQIDGVWYKNMKKIDD